MLQAGGGGAVCGDVSHWSVYCTCARVCLCVHVCFIPSGNMTLQSASVAIVPRVCVAAVQKQQ